MSWPRSRGSPRAEQELHWCFPHVSTAPFQPCTFSSRASLTSRHLSQGFSGTVVLQQHLSTFPSLTPRMVETQPSTRAGLSPVHRGLNHMAVLCGSERPPVYKPRYLLFYFPFLSSEWEDCTFTPSRPFPLCLVCFVLSSGEPVKHRGSRWEPPAGPSLGDPAHAGLLLPPKWALIYASLQC